MVSRYNVSTHAIRRGSPSTDWLHMDSGLTINTYELSYFRNSSADQKYLLDQLLQLRLEHATLMLSVAITKLAKSPVGIRLELSKSISAMVALEESYPELMDEFFYAQPTSVNWANHIIRSLETKGAQESSGFVFQAAYLNAMLAAMSIRAGKAFKFRVPVIGGRLMLPTLGVIKT
jgi:HEXXH motif-containing protein